MTTGGYVLHAYCDALVYGGTTRLEYCGRMEEFVGESYRESLADGREHGWKFYPGGEFCWCREHADRTFEQRQADVSARRTGR